MDLNSLLNTPQAHKRTSSGAENINIGQPVFKQPRGDKDAEENKASTSGSSSSSSSDDAEPHLDGVYIVQSGTGSLRDDKVDNRIIGVFVSEEDAEALMEQEKQDMINGGRQVPEHEFEDSDYGSGWTWEDEREDEIHTCSVVFHKLIWPTPKSDASSASSKSSRSSSGSGGMEVEKQDDSGIFGQK